MGPGPRSMGTGGWLWGWEPPCIVGGWVPAALVLGAGRGAGTPWLGLVTGLGARDVVAGSWLGGRGLPSVAAGV